jgi:hypothetical protein
MRSLIALLLAVSISAIGGVSAAEFPTIGTWAPEGEPRTYAAENLWEAINGGAELFIAYGVREMSEQDIRSGNLIVAVQIYDMGDPLNAYGIYTTERGPDDPKFRIGTESIITPFQVLLLKGRYYVKADVLEGEIGEAKGKDLLASLNDALPGSTAFPPELQVLPTNGKLENTERYIKESFLGLSELRECVYAQYGSEARPYQIFAIVRDKDMILEGLKRKWKNRAFQGRVLLYRQIPYKGLVGVIATEKGILGLAGTENATELEKRFGQLLGQTAPPN